MVWYVHEVAERREKKEKNINTGKLAVFIYWVPTG